MKNHVSLPINHLVNFIYTMFFPGVVLFFALFPQQGIFLHQYFNMLPPLLSSNIKQTHRSHPPNKLTIFIYF